MEQAINVGLIGYGFGGRIFHAPFISAVQGLKLCKVRETKAENVAHLEAHYPQVQVVSQNEDILCDDTVQMVVITTLNAFHYELAAAALKNGKHVVVDKPMTLTSAEADALIELAGEKGLVLSAFQNRRWDSDFKTVRKVVEGRLLGDVVSFEAHFDRFRPHLSENWREKNRAGSGMLYDLGSHLIDQAQALFGIPEEIFADLQVQRPGGEVDDSFEILLRYPGLRVSLKCSMLVREQGPHFILHGTRGSYVKYGMDVQEDDLISGKRPGKTGEWGKEPENLWGRLNTDINGLHFEGRLESEPGDYRDYYRNVAGAIKGTEPLAVSARQARNTIRIIELAQKSQQEKRWIPFE